MKPDELARTASILELALDHHNPRTPARYDLGSLGAQLGGGGLIGKILENPQLILALLVWVKGLLEKSHSEPTKTGVDGKPVTPSVAWPPVAAPAPEAAALLESWVEEAWHDWFKGTLEGEPDSDWAPGGGRTLSKILGGSENMPPGAVVRFMTGIADPAGGPASVGTGREPIEHVWVVQDGNGGTREYVLRSDAADVQSVPGLGHVQFGPRWRAGNGWDVTVRLAELKPGPGKVTYHARGRTYESSPEVSFAMSGPKQ